jgi:uncharacterized protein YegL
VKLTYEQALKKNLGEYELVQFLETERPADNLKVTVNIDSENQLTSLEVPNFKAAKIEYLSSNSGRVRYETDSMPPSELRVVFETANPPLNGNMLFYEDNGQGYMMHIFSPGEEDLGTSPLDKEIIFVLDESGSMQGYKIAQVKDTFGKIIKDLPPGDYFNIISFDTTVKSYSETLMEANQEEKSKAVEFVNDLQADGKTNINEALLRALRMFSPESGRVPIIVFLTDGLPTEGVVSPHAIRQNLKDSNVANVSIFSIAFGIDDESNYNFLKAMSLENYGTAEWFSPDNATEEIGSFYETISTPLITDMDFSYSGGVSEIVSTGKKNLFAGSDAIILGRYSPETGKVLAEISATTRSGDRIFSKEFPVKPENSNTFIPRLWAYTTINSLLDRIRVEGESDKLVSEVTGLALEFGFVTPYTSLFIELPDKVNPYPADTENGGAEEKPTEETVTGTPDVKGDALADNSMSSSMSAPSQPATGQSKYTSSQTKPASVQSKSASGESKSASRGSGNTASESAASSSSDRSSDSTKSAQHDGAAGGAEKKQAPDFGVLLALGGFFGTAALFRKR